MAFSWNQFVAERTKDNSQYERIKTSSLHALCALLQKGMPSAHQVATEMKKVPREKWRKYVHTKKYLLKEIGGLPSLVKDHLGKIQNFHTRSMTATGASIRHVLDWTSSTGNKDDLAHVLTREHVSWSVPAPDARACLHPDYQAAGRHQGVGNAATTPGSTGTATDDHDIAGPFKTPAAAQYHGAQPVTFKQEQVYEFSEDSGKTWQEIPNSRFVITRKLEAGPTWTIHKKALQGGQECTATAKL